jgi:hypothetical protein
MSKDKKRRYSYAKPGQVPQLSKVVAKKHETKKRNPDGTIRGNLSLVEKLTQANLLPAVCVETRKFRMANPISSYVDLYMHLNSVFGDWFPTNKKLYSGQNFSKQLNQSKEWQAAYWSGHYTIDDMLATKIQSGLYNDAFDNKDIVKLYDIQRRSVENKQLLDSIEKNVSVSMSISENDGEC